MTNLAIAGFFAVFAALTGYGFVSQRRRTRRMAETETTRSDQVLEGLVELKGTVRARETVRDPLSNDEAVLVTGNSRSRSWTPTAISRTGRSRVVAARPSSISKTRAARSASIPRARRSRCLGRTGTKRRYEATTIG